MAKHKFMVRFEGEAELVLDTAVLKQVDDDWRQTFYRTIVTPEQVARHIAYNMIFNQIRLRQIDGFANLKDEMASMSEFEPEISEVKYLGARRR